MLSSVAATRIWSIAIWNEPDGVGLTTMVIVITVMSG